MSILINIFVFLSAYTLLGMLLLAPFILSARISHWEEHQR